MKTLFHDWETYSECDIRKVGHWKYARHPSTEVLMVSYQINNGLVEQIDWTNDDVFTQQRKNEFMDMLTSSEYLKRAWNASFEYAIAKYTLGLPVKIEQYRCTMVIAATLTLPMGLAKCCETVGLGEDSTKQSAGKSLIKLFSCPRKPTKTKPYTRVTKEHEPKKWEDFLGYNRFDTKADYGIFCKLKKWDLSDEKWALWHLDQKINERGIPMDRKLIENAIAVDSVAKARLLQEAQEITGLENPKSRDQLLGWLYDNDINVPDLGKDRLTNLLETEPLPEHVARVIELRLQLSKTSVSKFNKAHECMDQNDRISGALQFAGAQRTWRWGGRLIQPQNLPGRGVDDVVNVVDVLRNCPELFSLYYTGREPEMMAGACRPMIRAPEGKKLIVADLNAIENRVLGPLTGCQKIINIFANGLDPYKMFATEMFKVKYEDVDKWMRTQAKPGVLGGGYRLGGGDERYDKKKGEYYKTGLWGYAENMGIELTREMSHKSIQVFREGHKEVVEFWDDIERAAIRCIRTKKTAEVNEFIRFEWDAPFMKMVLPSGRGCYYYQPRMEMKTPPWEGARPKPTICYTGYVEKGDGSTTRIWGTITTHGGKLTENADQAISADILGQGLQISTDMGFAPVMHVHDEIITLVDEDSPLTVEDLCKAMSVTPKWMPTLPLASEGYENKYYIKD